MKRFSQLAAPYIVWAVIMLLLPMLLIVLYAFTDTGNEIMTFRFVIAWVVLFLLSPRPIRPKSLKGELPFVGAGITGLTLYSGVPADIPLPHPGVYLLTLDGDTYKVMRR